jgi:glycosyltransferase 2 family protein
VSGLPDEGRSSGEPAGEPDGLTGRVRRVVSEHGIWVTAVLTVVVFAGLFLFGDAGQVTSALAQFDMRAFAVVIGLTTVGYLVRFVKWELYLDELDIDVPRTTSLTVFFSGLMMVVTPGKAGEVWKAWLLRDMEDVPASKTTPVVGAERITDVVSLAVLASVGVVAYGRSPAILAAVVVAFVAGLGLLQWRAGCLRILSWAEGLPVVGEYADEFETFYESTYVLFRFRPLALATVLSIAAWALEGIALWVTLAGFGVEVSILAAVFVFALGSVIGAVSLLPGGLGAAEASMTGLLLTFSVAEPIAVAATLVVRVGTLWYAAVLGFAVFSVHKLLGGEPNPEA